MAEEIGNEAFRLYMALRRLDLPDPTPRAIAAFNIYMDTLDRAGVIITPDGYRFRHATS